jgi:NADH:ubiquinone oxidoreductase subunit K
MDIESDEIIEKYKITGFWRTRFAKRTILFRQEGSAMMHTFIGKFLWIISLSLLPTAGFMYLLYWRQRRYFSEHVVWLLHLNCLTFILFPLLGLGVIYQDNDIADWLAAPFLIAATIAPFIALKRYYKQSWGKTILKGFIFQIAYSIIGTIAFLIGGIVSFLFL